MVADIQAAPEICDPNTFSPICILKVFLDKFCVAYPIPESNRSDNFYTLAGYSCLRV